MYFDSFGFAIPEALHQWFVKHENADKELEWEEARPLAWRQAVAIRTPGYYFTIDTTTLDKSVSDEIIEDCAHTFDLDYAHSDMVAERLQRILERYAVHCGYYSKGMNSIAAFALLVFCKDKEKTRDQDEEEAFWTLDLFCNDILMNYFKQPDYLGLHIDQKVLIELLKNVDFDDPAGEKNVFEPYFPYIGLLTHRWFIEALTPPHMLSHTALKLWDWLLESKSAIPLHATLIALLRRHRDTVKVAKDPQDALIVLKNAPLFDSLENSLLVEALAVASKFEAEEFNEYRFLVKHEAFEEKQHIYANPTLTTLKSLEFLSETEVNGIMKEFGSLSAVASVGISFVTFRDLMRFGAPAWSGDEAGLKSLFECADVAHSGEVDYIDVAKCVSILAGTMTLKDRLRVAYNGCCRENLSPRSPTRPNATASSSSSNSGSSFEKDIDRLFGGLFASVLDSGDLSITALARTYFADHEGDRHRFPFELFVQVVKSHMGLLSLFCDPQSAIPTSPQPPTLTPIHTGSGSNRRRRISSSTAL